VLTLQKTHRLIHPLAQWILLGLIIIANPILATPSEQDLIDAAKGTPKKLNIYNWADYINPEAITDFEEEFGIDVTYDIYDSSEIVDTKLMTGRSGYDVVVHASSFTSRLASVGIFHQVEFY